MKHLLLLVALATVQLVSSCDPNVCQPPNCRCMSIDTPGGLSKEETPQLVFLTFEDAINVVNYNNYTSILRGRSNPNGCPISMTFYVNHKNNDYELTHSLYWMGNEMASKTISDTEKQSEQWANMGTEELKQEIGGLRDILSNFAKVPAESIRGYRSPNLQSNGNFTMDALQELDFSFDNSYSTIENARPSVWPYTLDYGFQQDCQDAKGKCPGKNSQYPGKWIVPMAVLYANESIYCAMADACPTPENEVGTYEYLRRNFDASYNSNKAPVGIYLHAAWFLGYPHTLTGYLQFLDYLRTLPDVYIVSVSKGLDWVKNPVPLMDISDIGPLGCPEVTPTECYPRRCYYYDEQTGDDIFMNSCVNCPDQYPWVGNPSGSSKAKTRADRH